MRDYDQDADDLKAVIARFPVLMDVPAIQKLAAVSKSSIDRATAAGELTPVVPPGGRKRRFRRDEVVRWLGLSEHLEPRKEGVLS